MISHRHECIFVHIPKNAGQSVERVFLKLEGLTWDTRAPLLMRGNDRPELGPPKLSHLRAAEYIRCGWVTPAQFAGYFKFAFVRNPWDRMVSIYRWHRYDQICTFKRFLTRDFPRDLWRGKRWFVGPQTDFVCDDNGDLLVDFVGRFESLQLDFARVCRSIGLRPTPLPHVNDSDKKWAKTSAKRELKRYTSYPWWIMRGQALARTRRTWRDFYDEEAKAIVEELYRSDIEMFGYEFDPAPAGGPPGDHLTNGDPRDLTGVAGEAPRVPDPA